MKDKKIKKQLNRRLLEDIKSISNMQIIDKLIAKNAMVYPVFLQEKDDMQTILQKLRKEEIYTCIVVNKNKEFIGEISVEDIIKLFLNQINQEPLIKYLTRGYKKGFFYKTAGDICKKHKNFIKKDTDINQVIKLIYKNGFNYIPVINNKKQVLGVITPSSLINLLKDY